MLLSGELSGVRFRQQASVFLELEIDRRRIALGDQPSLYFQNRRTHRLIAATRGCKNTAKLNQPPFLTGHIDKAVHARYKVGATRNIVAKHIVVAQDFVESRRIKAGQYRFTQLSPHLAIPRVTRHFDPRRCAAPARPAARTANGQAAPVAPSAPRNSRRLVSIPGLGRRDRNDKDCHSGRGWNCPKHRLIERPTNVADGSQRWCNRPAACG